MSNVSALQVTLDALDDLGRLERIDAALVEAARRMAAALDGDPGNAALWRQYREAIKELRADDGNSSSLDDDIDALFADAGDSPAS